MEMNVRLQPNLTPGTAFVITVICLLSFTGNITLQAAVNACETQEAMNETFVDDSLVSAMPCKVIKLCTKCSLEYHYYPYIAAVIVYICFVSNAEVLLCSGCVLARNVSWKASLLTWLM